MTVATKAYVLSLALVGVGCAAPFEMDRHHIQDFRILHAYVHEGVADAVVWSGKGPHHQESPKLRWYIEETLCAEGFSVEVPYAEEYRLEVDNGEDILQAIVPYGTKNDVRSLSRSQWTPTEDQDYSIEARNAMPTESVARNVSQGKAARLSLQPDDELQTLRWSAAGGSILELSTYETDLFFDQLVFEEGTLVSKSTGTQHDIHVFALQLDNNNGSAYQWIDVHFGEEERVMHQEMMLPLAQSFAETGLISTEIVVEDGVLRFVATELVEEVETTALPCMQGEELFQLSWLRQGRCALNELQGHRLTLEVR